MQLRDNGNWSGGVPQPFQRFLLNTTNKKHALSNQHGISSRMVNLLLTARDYVNQVSFGLPIYLGTVVICVSKVPEGICKFWFTLWRSLGATPGAKFLKNSENSGKFDILPEA
ncbi:hypothetical protein T4B_9729 [Trichinella pseudospiralis]|uniref:Uncharacterized protein n=1 Tax=Trichinella pseudospiralis TaxID=6337 RepID=A0A0V1GSP4_TRIPS|nr:hypothetical protein T4B_9729 [Trichinella pseudospiralis]